MNKSNKNKPILPNTLLDAESDIFESLKFYLDNTSNNRLSISLKFENLRLNPVVYRLYNNLQKLNKTSILLWADAGGAALAKRDMKNLENSIYSFKEFISCLSNFNQEQIIIAVNPQPFDFEEFKEICDSFIGKIIMLNGKLEDMAVGIGNVGRERRKQFIYSWKNVYWLQPFNGAALMKDKTNDWYLFKQRDDGYIFCESFENKPDEESILFSLSNLQDIR
tara:strand:- start:7285 stop:7950 length:666 start_codon:yes stop_codon:yes gene_type:complete